MNKTTLISHLRLQEHIEGGYFARTYQSERHFHDRSLMSSIYYLLTDDRPIGHFHLNKSDILHCFHLGSPMTYLTISPDGMLETFILGPDITKGHVLQQVVKGGYWKASILEHGEFGLLSEAVSPGFDYQDMTIAKASTLKLLFPKLWDQIVPYVRQDT